MIEKTPPLPWEITSKEVNLEEIQAASKRISSIVPPTPVSRSIFQSDLHSLNVWLKLENFNVTGSFKIRGAANSLTSLMKEDMASGVIAASAGNHAQGIAYVSKILGIKSKIFMPERTPLNKVEATRAQGAEVILNGAIYDDAFTLAQAEQKSSGGLLVHAFSDAATINGQGTAGLEILQQIPNVGAVIIPVGGGGLCGGVACAIKSINPKVKIIGVQTKSFPAMKSARDSGFIEPMVFGTTIADGIAVKRPSPRTLSLSLKYVDELVTVSEDEIAASIMSLMEKDHILAEGAGAVGIAALQNVATNLRKELGSEPICIIISGGNIDVTLLSRISTRGLIASGRMMLLTVRTKDQPGKLAEILQALSKTGANLIEVKHNRIFGAMYYSDVDIDLELETINFEHQTTIKKAMAELNLTVINR